MNIPGWTSKQKTNNNKERLISGINKIIRQMSLASNGSNICWQQYSSTYAKNQTGVSALKAENPAQYTALHCVKGSILQPLWGTRQTNGICEQDTDIYLLQGPAGETHKSHILLLTGTNLVCGSN